MSSRIKSGAADVDVNVLGDFVIGEFAAEMFSREDVERRNDAVLEDVLPVIDVVQEKIQGGDALGQAAFEVFPFLGGDDAGNEIEGENLFGALLVAIDIESDALTQEGQVHGLALVIELLLGERLEQFAEPAVVRAGHTVGGEHFVEIVFGVVALQHLEWWWRFGLRGHFITVLFTFGQISRGRTPRETPANSDKIRGPASFGGRAVSAGTYMVQS